MTVTPSMTPKTTVTSVVLVCIGIAALVYGLHLGATSATGTGTGWRKDTTVLAPANPVTFSQSRGSNSAGLGGAAETGDISTARGRN